MGGLLILFLGALYVWGAFKVVSLVKLSWAKVLLVLLFILIPTADAIYGRIKLRQMCAKEGDLKIYRIVEGVDGFYEGDSRPSGSWIKEHGYRFVEGKGLDGRIMRLSLKPDGQISEETDSVMRSRYRYEYFGSDFGDGYTRVEQQIKDLITGEVLANAPNISYEGGWVEQLIAGIYASKGFAGACKEGVDRIWPDQIISRTLKPRSDSLRGGSMGIATPNAGHPNDGKSVL